MFNKIRKMDRMYLFLDGLLKSSASKFDTSSVNKFILGSYEEDIRSSVEADYLDYDGTLIGLQEPEPEPEPSIPFSKKVRKRRKKKAVPKKNKAQDAPNIRFEKILNKLTQDSFNELAKEAQAIFGNKEKPATSTFMEFFHHIHQKPKKKAKLKKWLVTEESFSQYKYEKNIFFRAELHKLKMLSSPTMLGIASLLLEQEDEQNLECLCQLLISSDLQLSSCPSNASDSQSEDGIFIVGKLKQVANSQTISPRVRDMVVDALKLYKMISTKENLYFQRKDQSTKIANQNSRKVAGGSKPNLKSMSLKNWGRGSSGELTSEPGKPWFDDGVSHHLDNRRPGAAIERPREKAPSEDSALQGTIRSAPLLRSPRNQSLQNLGGTSSEMRKTSISSSESLSNFVFLAASVNSKEENDARNAVVTYMEHATSNYFDEVVSFISFKHTTRKIRRRRKLSILKYSLAYIVHSNSDEHEQRVRSLHQHLARKMMTLSQFKEGFVMFLKTAPSYEIPRVHTAIGNILCWLFCDNIITLKAISEIMSSSNHPVETLFATILKRASIILGEEHLRNSWKISGLTFKTILAPGSNVSAYLKKHEIEFMLYSPVCEKTAPVAEKALPEDTCAVSSFNSAFVRTELLKLLKIKAPEKEISEWIQANVGSFMHSKKFAQVFGTALVESLLIKSKNGSMSVGKGFEIKLLQNLKCMNMVTDCRQFQDLPTFFSFISV